MSVSATPGSGKNDTSNIWGKCREPTKIPLSLESESKPSIRQKVWEFLERNDIANFPRPVYQRIPNFKGASTAGQSLSRLPEFAAAKTIKVNPDKPQEEVRYQVLDHDKSLIVPTPRLSKGLFNRLSVPPGTNSKEELRKLASRHGIDNDSKPVPMASRFKIDLFVVGCVAVDRCGRRLGKGEGFADLEWAMASSNHGSAVGPDTVVVTTVHDCQVFDSLPANLFEAHDLSVDIIVTPTEVIRVGKPLKKPTGIIWNLLTREKFQSIEILTEIQYKELRAGNDVRLKDEDSSSKPDSKSNSNHNNSNSKNKRNKKPRQLQQNGGGAEADGGKKPEEATPTSEEGAGPKKNQSRNQRRREMRQQRQREGEELGKAEGGDGSETTAVGGRRPRKNNRNNRRGGANEGEQQQPENPEENGEDSSSNNKNINKPKKKPNQRNRKGTTSSDPEGASPAIPKVTVFIGRIPRTARFKELKEALAERGVKVSGSGGNYSNTLVWKGNKGFAFLNCDERTHSLEDLAKQLDGLKLGDTELNIKTDQRKQRKVSEITEAEKGAVVVPPDSADESKGSDGQSGGGSDSKVKAAKKSERQKKGDGSNQKKKSEDKEAAGNDAAQKEVKDSVPAKNTTTGDKESAPVPESADASKGSNSSSTSGENKKEPIVPKKEDDGSNQKKKGEDKEATDNAAPQKERVDSVPAKKETEAQSGEAAPPVEKENS